jgi:predicted nucleotidyltransferase
MLINKAEILSALNQHREQLQERFAVKHLALFGSAARDALREGGDVDVLVEFVGPATFSSYMDLKFYLEDLLGRPVDLVTDKALRHELRPYIEKEMIRIG